MSNIRESIIDSKLIGFLVEKMGGKALLISKTTEQALDNAKLPSTLKEESSMEDIPLVNPQYSNNPFVRAASNVVGYDVTSQVANEPKEIKPEVSPSVIAPEFEQPLEAPTPEPIPTPQPEAVPEVNSIEFDTVQPIQPEIPDLSIQDAINSELVSPREENIITPQVEEKVNTIPTTPKTDPYVSLNVKLEGIREEFNRKLDALKEEFNKKIIDEMSREVEALRENAKYASNMSAITEELNNQYNAMDEQLKGYSNGR